MSASMSKAKLALVALATLNLSFGGVQAVSDSESTSTLSAEQTQYRVDVDYEDEQRQKDMKPVVDFMPIDFLDTARQMEMNWEEKQNLKGFVREKRSNCAEVEQFFCSVPVKRGAAANEGVLKDKTMEELGAWSETKWGSTKHYFNFGLKFTEYMPYLMQLDEYVGKFHDEYTQYSVDSEHIYFEHDLPISHSSNSDKAWRDEIQRRADLFEVVDLRDQGLQTPSGSDSLSLYKACERTKDRQKCMSSFAQWNFPGGEWNRTSGTPANSALGDPYGDGKPHFGPAHVEDPVSLYDGHDLPGMPSWFKEKNLCLHCETAQEKEKWWKDRGHDFSNTKKYTEFEIEDFYGLNKALGKNKWDTLNSPFHTPGKTFLDATNVTWTTKGFHRIGQRTNDYMKGKEFGSLFAQCIQRPRRLDIQLIQDWLNDLALDPEKWQKIMPPKFTPVNFQQHLDSWNPFFLSLMEHYVNIDPYFAKVVSNGLFEPEKVDQPVSCYTGYRAIDRVCIFPGFKHWEDEDYYDSGFQSEAMPYCGPKFNPKTSFNDLPDELQTAFIIIYVVYFSCIFGIPLGCACYCYKKKRTPYEPWEPPGSPVYVVGAPMLMPHIQQPQLTVPYNAGMQMQQMAIPGGGLGVVQMPMPMPGMPMQPGMVGGDWAAQDWSYNTNEWEGQAGGEQEWAAVKKRKSSVKMVRNRKSEVQEAGLPPNWVKGVDDSGNVYYWNEVTWEQTWDRPTKIRNSEKPIVRQRQSEVKGPGLPEHWVEGKDAQGNLYYWNEVTEEQRWTKPTS